MPESDAMDSLKKVEQEMRDERERVDRKNIGAPSTYLAYIETWRMEDWADRLRALRERREKAWEGVRQVEDALTAGGDNFRLACAARLRAAREEAK